MKMFTKLALVSSIAISANAMAMQSMDDAALSATTGQDGITMTIDTASGVSIEKLYLHDNDGLAAGSLTTGQAGYGGTGTAGAIVLNDVTVNKQSGVTDPLATLVIDTDAGKNNDAFLNIAASIAAVDLHIGDISVVASKGNAAPATGVERGAADTAKESVILSNFNVAMGASTATIQLGHAPQGAMIKLDSKIDGGLTISDLGLVDSANGGQITLGEIRVADKGSKNLTASADIAVTPTGLKITGVDPADGRSIYIKNLSLSGSAGTGGAWTAGASIGDVEIVGLKTGDTSITIAGH